MTTHLTHPEDLDGEEPELVLIDDEEFEAAHSYEDDEDDFEPDDSDFEIAFADDLEEAVTGRTSSQGHGPDADNRMAGLFSAQHEVLDGAPQVSDAAEQNFVTSQRGRAVSTAAIAGVAVAGAVSTPAPRSRRETGAEKKRQRELLKRRNQMNKAAHEDDKERQRAQRESEAAAVKEAAAAAKRAAAEAKQQAAADKKRAAAEAKQRQADDKVRAAEEKQRAAAEAKQRQADEKARAAEDKQRAAEEKRRQAEDKKRAAIEAKQRRAEDKQRQTEEKARAAAEAKQRRADDKARAAEDKQRVTEAKKRLVEAKKRAAVEAKQRQAQAKQRQAQAKQRQAEEKPRPAGSRRRKTSDNAGEFSAAAIMGRAQSTQAESDRTDRTDRTDRDGLDWLKADPVVSRQLDAKATPRDKGANRALLVAVAVVVVVAAGGLIYAKTRAHTATPANAGAPTTAAASVGGALAAMTKSSTADVIYSMSLSGGQTVTVNGGGNIDLASDAANLSLTYAENGQTFPEQLVYVGSSAYYDLGLSNHDTTPGSDWVQMDLVTDHPADPGLGAGGALSDPSSLVALVDASSATATEVGSTELNGAPATEYSINLNAAQIARLTDLPSFVSGQLAMEPFTQVSFEVFVNGSGQVSLIEAIGTQRGSGQPVLVHTTVEVSRFGIPVSVVAPAPSEVVSEQQYESNAQRLANAPGA